MMFFCCLMWALQSHKTCSFVHRTSRFHVFLSLLLFCMLPGDWLPCGQHQWAAPRWPRGLHSASSPQVITRALGRWEGIKSGPCTEGPLGPVHQRGTGSPPPLHPLIHTPTHPCSHPSIIHPPTIHLPIQPCIPLSIHPFIHPSVNPFYNAY